MAQLKQVIEETKQFMLPSTAGLPELDQAWVRMDVGPMTGGDYLDIAEDQGDGSYLGRVLTQRIKEWNFTEPDGTPIPIITANIRRMEAEDLTYLISQIKKEKEPLTTEQKKT